MKNFSSGLLFLAVLFLSFSPNGLPQASETSRQGAPTPRRDLNGVWSGNAVMQLEPVAEMTAWGQDLFDAARPLRGPRAVPVAESNDGFAMCDPLGFPRNILYEMRGVEFAQTQNKMLMLFQYQRVWREIWTDGRSLPSNIGGDAPDSLDPRWYGYSIGRWVDDYTFVVNSTGFNETGWSDSLGHPRSTEARIEERYHRIDRDTIEITVTIDDPKAYIEPFVAMREVLRWDPNQEFEEQLCVPSEALNYLSTFRPREQPTP
jgi:hypothetical protein